MTVHDMTLTESIEIAAPPQAAYDTIRQLERMGEWSPENLGGTWAAGDGSAVGDVFDGVNRIGDREWTASATIVRAEPGEVFAFVTGPADDPMAEWTYSFEASGAGTTVTETWDVHRLPPTLESFTPEELAGRKAMVHESIKTTLARLKESIET